MRFISAAQQKQDHKGLRDHCAADGHPATKADPLVLSTSGSRIHQSHTTDPRNGFYGQQQED